MAEMNSEPVERRPGVVPWFYAYAVLMTVIYVLAIAAGLWLGSIDPASIDVTAEEVRELEIYGWLLPLCGVPLAIIFVVALFLPRRPWAWIYDLVLICIAFTSVCFLPIAIPLLIFWIRQDTRRWFGMSG